MNQKTWPEYPPPGLQAAKIKPVWLLAIVIFAAAAAFGWYAQQARDNAIGSHQAAELRGPTDPSFDPKPTQSDDAALADALANDLFPTFEDGQPIRREMAWTECVQYLDTVTLPLDAPRTEVVRNDNARVVRFDVGDGSVLLTCTRADNTLTILPSAPSTSAPTAPPSKP